MSIEHIPCAPQGWQCPVCGTVNAPFMPVCANGANHGKTITGTTTQPRAV